ncbi:MAG: hypothetical protein H6747_00060 [Deltaproteobacteria bacterium]|nr:hypothetical protein [Deltaproteobacteria bacterium]
MRRPHLLHTRTAAGASRSLLVALAVAFSVAACGTDGSNQGDTSQPADTADTGGSGDVDAGGNPDIPIDVNGGETDGGACSQPDDCAGKVTLKACEVAACNAGKCEVAAAPAGTGCDDGSKCTTNDQCDAAGKCVGGAPDCPDNGPCKIAFCDVTGACDYNNVPPAQQKACDDGNACTKDDICGPGGTCGGIAIDVKSECDDENDCTSDECEAATGCVHNNVAKDTPCFDGNQCTADDICDGDGKCVGGVEVKCIPTGDNANCQKGTCDPVAGCKFSTVQDGVTCSNGNKCQTDQQCLAGKCKGTPIAGSVPTSACVQVTCDPETAKITQANSPDGVSCSDDNPCTNTDTCAKGVCAGTPKLCNDGNPCTLDTCDPATGVCKSEAIKDGETCDDNNECTSKDACIGGKCTGEDYTVSKKCDDNNPCTNDGCAPQSGCFNPPKNGGVCEDGDKCTTGDTCVTGKCTGKAKACDDSNPCTNDACDPVSGECKSTQFDGPCDDGNKCTSNDVCAAGKCEGKLSNCNDNNPCTDDTCDTIIGCKNTPKFGGTPCDDGLACTTNDKCDGGQCVGKNECVACSTDIECAKYDDGNICTGTMKCVDTPKGKVCDVDPKTVITCPAAPDPACGASLCDGTNGKCSVKNKAEGTPCTSANKCIEQTTCGADGKCGGTPVDCDDDNPCTDDTCNPTSGCEHKAKADDTDCDDGNQCTPTESCKSGACIAAQNVCGCKADSECTKWDDGNLCNGLMACIAGFCSKLPNSAVTCDASKDACKDNLCDTKSGQCGLVGKKDGTSCDDGDACSIQEACTGGACKSTASIDCGDDNPCTFDVCDPFFGCFNAPAGENGPCDDGSACTKGDKCVGGKCAGTKLECDDDNPCTIDVCDAKSGKCTALLDNNLKCDDGDPCTEGDKCLDGVCKAAQLKCDDGNPCTIDGCDGQGGCKNVLEPNKDCDDGDACTVIDRCDFNGKCAGKAKDCDDGNKCTSAGCNKGVCVIQPLTGEPCNDGNACTEKDRCDNKGDCIADVVNCDDGNPCTKIAGPCSTVNGCTVVPNDGIACNDGSLCTIADKCASGECKGVNLPCDDGNVCTNDSCDPKKGCVNAQNTCDDSNDCTFDKCDSSKGCVSSALDGFQPCDDGDKCTEKGVCNGTKCESKLVLCDDENPCTIDTCTQEAGGCVSLPDPNTATVCSDNNVCTDDACDGKGKCVGVEKLCDDGNPCTQDSCDKLKGCVTTDLEEKTPCDDGDPCSSKTVCQGGICSGGNYDLCPACENGEDADCAIYDDNNLCNGKYVCKKKDPKATSGFCHFDPDPTVCDTTGDTPCQKNVCETTSGTCKPTQLVNGSQCEDGLPCTIGDTCQNGSCSTGAPADCSSVSDGCNTSTCIGDPTAQLGYSCVPLPKAGTVACDADGSGCTANDFCKEGKCQAGKPVNCDAVAGECEVAACVKDGANGFTCKISAAPDNAECDDGQLCTVGDFCKTGTCQAGTKPYECKDEVDTQCAIGQCDKAANEGTGGCTAKPTNEGQVCDSDDNGCTVNDICVQGFCVPGAPVNCNEKSGACTVGACKSLGGKSYECVAAPVNESKPCEADNNGCTLDDHCEAGKCAPGKPMDCSKFDANGGCLVGTCKSLSASQGSCTAVPAQVGLSCDADNNGCTKGDACNKDGACVPGAAVNCLAQGGSCATGACSSTGKDSYKCLGDPKPDGTSCDADGDGCTVDDKCAAGACVAGGEPDCSAETKSACIVGGCTTKGSDKYLCEPYPKKNGDVCDADKNGCTKNDTCQLGFCEAGALETCKDLQSACAKAECEDKGGTNFVCAVTPVESYPPLSKQTACDPKAKAGETGACPANYICTVGTAGDTEGNCQPKVSVSCTDGDACTVEDVCVNGNCQGGQPPDCDDKDACTLDVCDKGQCKHQPIQGCGQCLVEDFTKDMSGWFTIGSAKTITGTRSTVVGPDGNPNGSFAIAWDGSTVSAEPSPEDLFVSYRIVGRQLFLEADKTTVLTFSLEADMKDADCLEVYIDDATKVASYCGKVTPLPGQSGQVMAVDLSAHAGRAIQPEFRIVKAIVKDEKGSLTLRNITISGFCGAACMSQGFEPNTLGTEVYNPPVTQRRPQSWSFASTAAGYGAWLITDKAARSGSGSLVATYAGKPASGKAETMTLTIPGLTPVAGSKLSFALRATDIGEAGCNNGDKLVVSVDGADVYQSCDVVADWKVQTINLSDYAGKSVTVAFKVVSAATDKAKGTFQLDDITMTGQCSWLCFHESFDTSTDLPTWIVSGNMASGQNPPIQTKYSVSGGQSLASSKPYSMLIKSDATVPAGSLAVIGLAGTIPAARTSVAGGALTLKLNAVVDPASCNPNPPAPPALFIGVSKPGIPSISETEPVGTEVCKSTSGWETVTVQIPGSVGYEWVQPVLVATQKTGSKTFTTYVDDVQIICK